MTKSELKVGDRARIARWGRDYGFEHSLDKYSGTEGVITEISLNGSVMLRTDKGLRYGDISGLDPIPDPFAPGEYVTSIHDYVGVFGFIKNIRHIYKISGQSRPDTFENEGGFVLQKSDFRPATPEEIAAYKAKYEAKPEVEPNLTPQPRIAFTVGGQKFFIGQRIWSTSIDDEIFELGVELEVSGFSKLNHLETLVVRKVGTARVFCSEIAGLSATPPSPHEWKRGDWARHKDGRKAFVCGAWLSHGAYGPQQLVVSFENEAITGIPASEFTFIGHTEAPE